MFEKNFIRFESKIDYYRGQKLIVQKTQKTQTMNKRFSHILEIDLQIIIYIF